MGKMNSRILTKILLLLVLFSSIKVGLEAKDKKDIDFEIRILDESGKALGNAMLITSDKNYIFYANEYGVIKGICGEKEKLFIEAPGYNPMYLNTTVLLIPETVILHKDDRSVKFHRYIERSDDFYGTAYRAFPGAVSVIDGDEIRYPDLLLSNSLQGLTPGLDVSMSVGSGLSSNPATLNIRGMHRSSGNTPIVIVDGLERELDDIMSEEIEKIEILKDASAKIIYGARAANGVVLVKTKRGIAGKRSLDIKVESGVMVLSDSPDYLDSYNYAILYNEALANDGLPYKYNDTELEGYLNSSGANDLYYPNVDYHNRFLRETGLYRKAIVSMAGGNEKVRYSLVAGYVGGNGFENSDNASGVDRLNVRGNLDVKVVDFISAFVSSSARYELKSMPNLTTSSLFSLISRTRPNEFPLVISSDILGLLPREDGIPYFGASLTNRENVLAKLEYGGVCNEQYVISQTDIGLNFDFDEYVKGLRGQLMVALDNYNYIQEGQTNIYPSYARIDNGSTTPSFRQMTKLSLQSDLSRLGFSTRRTLGYNGHLSYGRSFAKHEVGASVAYNFYMAEVYGDSQNIVNNNTSLRLNYAYDSKYFLEGTISYVGSNKFSEDKRYFLSRAIGASWLISNEDFLKGSSVVNYLKLKATLGTLGYDRGTSNQLYKTAWKSGSEYKLGEQNKTIYYTTEFIRKANENMDWESSSELNVGIESMLFDNRFSFEVNYFNELRKDIIGSVDASYSNVLGSFYYYDNVGEISNQGVDFQANWSSEFNGLDYKIGFGALWSKSKVVDWNQLAYPDSGIVYQGKPVDAIFGYVDQGLFGKDIEISDYSQSLGHYQEGDIAYADLNGDNIIDQRDRKMIGNSSPRFSLSLDINLKYRNFEVYMLGIAKLGYQGIANSSFYWINGEDKYSVVAMDRYHSENNPNGTYPRLTTMDGSNNFVNSTFWLYDASFFRLKNIEVSYTFNRFKRICRSLKLYVRATNLFSIGGNGYGLDPEIPNAGISGYPLYKTFTGGISINL